MQMLRRHKWPVPGTDLAREAGVSLRTKYQDIGTLQAMGADIEGEPGFGYVLKPDFLLPPLMFSQEELHALTLGAQWVGRQTDDGLAFAAQNAIAKIEAVLPTELRHLLTDNGFMSVAIGLQRRLLIWALSARPCANSSSFRSLIATRRAMRRSSSSGQSCLASSTRSVSSLDGASFGRIFELSGQMGLKAPS